MFSQKFIAASDAFCDYENPVNAPIFRKTFNLEKEIYMPLNKIKVHIHSLTVFS